MIDRFLVDGLFVQFRVMKYDPLRRSHRPIARFWSDREPQKVDPALTYFFTPIPREYGKNTVDVGRCIFADVDKPDGTNWGLSPSLTVFTGGGYHYYWFFEDVVFAEQLQTMLNMLVKINADVDILCRDVTRFLRWPGSWNPKHGNKVEVVDESSDYELRKVLEWLYDEYDIIQVGRS